MFKNLFKKKLSPSEQYLNHLNKIFKKEPLLFKEDSLDKSLPGVTTIVYENIPEKGMITSFTYGLSLGNHPDWKNGRPELTLTVRSDNFSWGRVVGYLANQLRDKCPFSYGDPIDFQEKISDDSEMDGFLVFAPSIFKNKSDYNNLDIGAKYKIYIKGIYPIYSSEIEVMPKLGFERFWKHPNFDLYNINRNKITE
ncbi:MAG: suppressor of fused domain protein [Sphingobacterium sp.]